MTYEKRLALLGKKDECLLSINKRAGGMGIISGRKSFKRSFKDGIELLHAIQDVYLDKQIDVA